MSLDAMARLQKAMRDGLRPDPVLSVSEWADQYRMLDSSTSAAPGRWRTDKTPYLREIMDCLGSRHSCEMVVFMKGSQIGGSEAGNNWIGYSMHHSPAPMLMVQPTFETGEKYSKQRLAPMIAQCPELRERVGEPGSRDSGNTILMKEFPGGLLVIAGANSPSSLASMPIRRVFLDEVDRFPSDCGGEGDPVDLALKRTRTFSNRKILLVSTPTLRNHSRIEAAFVESDQRFYWVPCPLCQEMQVLVWGNVRWPDHDPDRAYYECEHCKGTIQNHHKNWMLPRGEWRPAQPGHTGGRVRGYHLSALYSPHGWTSWADLAREWVEVHKNPARLKVFINTCLGESWDESDGSRLDETGLMARCEVYDHPVPTGVGVLTASVDVQDNRLEVEVVGWGIGEESWSIDYVVMPGDPSGPALWEQLDTYLAQSWDAGEGRELFVMATCIDSGGHHTQKVYDFVRTRAGRRIWAIKGKEGQGRPVWPKHATKSALGKVDLFIVGVDTAKEEVYAHLRVTEKGPCFCHFPADRDVEYFKGLTAETRLVRRTRGFERKVWAKKDGVRNEPLDLRVYNRAALYYLLGSGLRLAQAVDKARKGVEASPQAPAPAKRDDWWDPRRKGRKDWF